MLFRTNLGSFHPAKPKPLSYYKIQKTSRPPAHEASQSPASTDCTSDVWWGQTRMQVLEKIVRKFLVLRWLPFLCLNWILVQEGTELLKKFLHHCTQPVL
jgi:hypothetical protein